MEIETSKFREYWIIDLQWIQNTSRRLIFIDKIMNDGLIKRAIHIQYTCLQCNVYNSGICHTCGTCLCTQRLRMNLNKESLPRSKTTTAWKLIPHWPKISKNWNSTHLDPLHRFFKNCFLLIQKQLYNEYISTQFT